MINTDDFVKRLESIFEYYSLTASSFADTIHVQRSSISHLLSGRNKPSLDFILKVIDRFPEVDLLWLLNGKGSFPKDENISNEKSSTTPFQKNINNEIHSTTDLFSTPETMERKEINYTNELNPNTTSNIAPTNNPINYLNNNSDVEQIVVFYKDGTFKTYIQKNPNLK